MKKIVMVHQGFELYGSDRSFVSSIKAIRNEYKVEVFITVILPEVGSLSEIVDQYADEIIYRPKGFLRKAALKRGFLSAISGLIYEVHFYKKLFMANDLIYINTCVSVSAILASSLYNRRSKFIHIREIPSSYQLFFFKTIMRLSNAILLYNSEATRSSFNLAGIVVLNGVPPLPSIKKEPQQEDTSKVRKKRFLVIGRINAWKGQQFFLDSVLPIKELISIRVVGSAFDGQDYFLDSLKSFSIDNEMDIEFFDFDKEPSHHFAWCDYVVVPSTEPEPFGRVAIESMSVSKPVIAAGHGGLSEIISDNVDGFLFVPKSKSSLRSKIEVAINLSSEEYCKLSDAAYEKYINFFSEEAYMNNFLKIIRKELN